jgi:hypothetical protein
MTSTRTSDPIGDNARRQAGHIHQTTYRPVERKRHTHQKPFMCRTCGTVLQDGRWQRMAIPPAREVEHARCPACTRERSNAPAGIVTLVGYFVRLHADELDRLIHREEAHHRKGNPGSRMTYTRRALDRIDVATTDIDLPLRIADALERAYGGAAYIQQGEEGRTIRVRWERD